MADQDLRIKVSAETGAAQDALGRLADEMGGLAKATDGAGNEQKKLARDTAEATAKVQAAREAVERAKRAQSEASTIAQAFGKDSREAADAQDRLRRAEEAATKAAREAERALEGTANAVREAAASADAKATPALRRMDDALQRAGKEAEKTASELRTLDARTAASSRSAGGFSATWGSFKGNLAANAVSTLGGFVRDAGLYAIETAANFERMKTALGTTLGSTEAANVEFERLQAFAAATPFSLEQVTEGFIKLKNQGLDASDRAMKGLGNTASAMGKSLDDIVEATLDAAQGEGERLKEFGIRMSKQGDNVALTFRGVTQTVKFESQAIQNYLVQLGETNFAGGMEAQSRTLGGMWSTMKDGLAQFTVAVMDSGITDGLKSMMSAVSGLGEVGGLLADVLGLTLGTAFQVVGGAMELLLPIVDKVAEGVRLLIWPFKELKAVVVDAGASIAEDFNKPILEAVAAQEKLRQEMVAQINATRATGLTGELLDRGVAYAGTLFEQARGHMAAAEAAKAQEDAEARLLAKMAKEDEKFAQDQFEQSMFIGPALPPGFKRPKEGDAARAHKKSNRGAMAREEFDSSIAAFEFETVQKLRAADLEAQELAFQRESELRGMRLTQLDREIEVAEITGAAHLHLIDQRFNAEIELAEWRAENAVTEDERAEARTQAEDARHRKQIAALKRTAAAEKEIEKKRLEDLAKEMERREKITQHVAGAITTLTEGMVGAFEQMARGEKGAMADMLADLLKGIAKKHAILALGEFAQGVGSTAATFGIVNPKAAAHFAAAALHTGVAVAAGVGAYAAGQVADARRESSSGGGGFGGGGSSGGFGPAGSGASGSDPGGSGDEGLQAQETPISHEQLRRENSMRPAARMNGGAQVNINGPVHLYGAGGRQEFIDNIRRDIDRSDRGGRRNRI